MQELFVSTPTPARRKNAHKNARPERSLQGVDDAKLLPERGRRPWDLFFFFLVIPAAFTIFAGGFTAACTNSDLAQRGAGCIRASDCAPGLFCVNRACSNDLSQVDGGAVSDFPIDASGGDVSKGDAPDAVANETSEASAPETPSPTDTSSESAEPIDVSLKETGGPETTFGDATGE
ncbi:MAG: hypothetical protein NVSMB1_12320 [Polyangiales bacterium]